MPPALRKLKPKTAMNPLDQTQNLTIEQRAKHALAISASEWDEDVARYHIRKSNRTSIFEKIMNWDRATQQIASEQCWDYVSRIIIQQNPHLENALMLYPRPSQKAWDRARAKFQLDITSSDPKHPFRTKYLECWPPDKEPRWYPKLLLGECTNNEGVEPFGILAKFVLLVRSNRLAQAERLSLTVRAQGQGDNLSDSDASRGRRDHLASDETPVLFANHYERKRGFSRRSGSGGSTASVRRKLRKLGVGDEYQAWDRQQSIHVEQFIVIVFSCSIGSQLSERKRIVVAELINNESGKLEYRRLRDRIANVPQNYSLLYMSFENDDKLMHLTDDADLRAFCEGATEKSTQEDSFCIYVFAASSEDLLRNLSLNRQFKPCDFVDTDMDSDEDDLVLDR